MRKGGGCIFEKSGEGVGWAWKEKKKKKGLNKKNFGPFFFFFYQSRTSLLSQLNYYDEGISLTSEIFRLFLFFLAVAVGKAPRHARKVPSRLSV